MRDLLQTFVVIIETKIKVNSCLTFALQNYLQATSFKTTLILGL